MIRLLQNAFASMSLERKSVLLFVSALVPLMLAAFWVVQLLAGKLVIDRTRQVARDFGAAKLMRVHCDAIYGVELSPDVRKTSLEVLNDLELKLLRPEYEYAVLSLGEETTYDNLTDATQPDDETERELLEQLRDKFYLRLEQYLAKDRPDLVQRPMLLEENEAFTQIAPGRQPLSLERGPIDGRYIHYTPVFSEPECLVSCHSPKVPVSFAPDADPKLLAQQYPFRVIRVSMPYNATQEANNWIRAVVIAVAMLIIAITVVVLHRIMRYLVLHPLYHLRDVSDAITHGDTNLRASIDTEDEFRELANAFNRMLRYLVETREQIQLVNNELDQRVDQLAQLNLQLYEANRLKSDFLANMSHELRTPLNSIIGFSEVLSGIDSLDDKQRRYATNIQKSGRVLLEMINDILDLAKVEAGKMEVRPVPFDLEMLVRAQADMVRSLSEDKNIQLTVSADDDLPQAKQDQNKFGQILTNLLSNAIKFTPEGGMINVRLALCDEDRFELSVSDTGVGIASEDQKIIFEKFRQSRKVLDGEGLTREFSGTGLGLSIVKELSKLLGGEVSFESQLGRGSTFYVRLPLIFTASPPMPTLHPLLESDES
ncbi:Signal transduction histidine-protein kinase BarA [Roseimaritima multifibrata]|uniref:histidine kinase n=1 Tax=Roseimaritima multifibrata TaxID=1930274 RepID=A0A517MJY0_9BACT|nr:ATP-binding protein [Roseimaritima multifibrata]QDS95199.1 Signal transduction histidine-protein kinase BarA [Roseimaritima multifibrata]